MFAGLTDGVVASKGLVTGGKGTRSGTSIAVLHRGARYSELVKNLSKVSFFLFLFFFPFLFSFLGGGISLTAQA